MEKLYQVLCYGNQYLRIDVGKQLSLPMVWK
ncbi:hypothetical protein PEAC54167_02185 [Pediococcus acidilactici]